MVMPLKSHFFMYMHKILIKGQEFILVLHHTQMPLREEPLIFKELWFFSHVNLEGDFLLFNHWLFFVRSPGYTENGFGDWIQSMTHQVAILCILNDAINSMWQLIFFLQCCESLSALQIAINFTSRRDWKKHFWTHLSNMLSLARKMASGLQRNVWLTPCHNKTSSTNMFETLPK